MKKVLIVIWVIIASEISILGQTVETVTGNFDASGGVAVSADGEVFVADFGRSLNFANGSRVYKVNKTTGAFEVFAQGLEGASGNAFDSEGNLIQSNIAGNRISKITPDGTVTTLASRGIAGPVGVAVTRGDTIYIANCGGNSIARITPDGLSGEWASSDLLRCPNGLAIDDDGNLYTCNFGNGRIIKIDEQTREVSLLANLPTGRNGHITYANGRLYVAGRCNHSIYEVLLTGEYRVIAGTGARGNKDGNAMQATFNHPNGIDASPDGDTLYINDAISLNGDCLSVPLNPVVLRRIVGVKKTITTVQTDSKLIPNSYSLEQNYPNPFNPSTTINFSIPDGGYVTLKIYNQLGEEIHILINEYKTAGTHKVEFNATDLASGIYIYEIVSEDYKAAKQMMLIK